MSHQLFELNQPLYTHYLKKLCLNLLKLSPLLIQKGCYHKSPFQIRQLPHNLNHTIPRYGHQKELLQGKHATN